MKFSALIGLLSIICFVNLFPGSLSNERTFNPITTVTPYLPNITVNASYKLAEHLLSNENVTNGIGNLLNLTSFYKFYSNDYVFKNFTTCLNTQIQSLSSLNLCLDDYTDFKNHLNSTILGYIETHYYQTLQEAMNELYNSTIWSSFLETIDFFNATECLINQILNPINNSISCMQGYTNLRHFINVTAPNNTAFFINVNSFLRENFEGIISASNSKAFSFSSFSSRVSGIASCTASMTTECANTYGISTFSESGGFDKLKTLVNTASASSNGFSGVPANFFSGLTSSVTNLQTTANSVLQTSTTKSSSTKKLSNNILQAIILISGIILSIY